MRPHRRPGAGSTGAPTGQLDIELEVARRDRRTEPARRTRADRRRRRVRVRDAAPQRLVGPRHPGLRVPAARPVPREDRSSPRSRRGWFPSTRSTPAFVEGLPATQDPKPADAPADRAPFDSRTAPRSRARDGRDARRASIAAHRVAGRGGRRALLVARAADRARDRRTGRRCAPATCSHRARVSGADPRTEGGSFIELTARGAIRSTCRTARRAAFLRRRRPRRDARLVRIRFDTRGFRRARRHGRGAA